MSTIKRLIGLIGFTLAIGLFSHAPSLFALDEAGMMTRATLAQVGGPLIAAICCFLASWQSRGDDRIGWALFGLAMALYFGGNLFYLVSALGGVEPSFPSPAEWAFLVMAPIFAYGAFIYGRVRQRLNRTSVFNFLLIFCAITIATIFALERVVAITTQPPSGTVVAIIYPAIWFSVAASCTLALLQFNLGGRTFAYSLITAAALAEAVADALYAGAILDGSYARGGLTELLWVSSIGLVVWAAFVQMSYARRPVRWLVAPRAMRRAVQAVVPGAAIAIAVLADAIPNASTTGYYLAALVVLTTGFGALAAFREFWIGKEQRLLRATVERGRNALIKSEQNLTEVLESTTDSIVVIDSDWRVEFMNQRAADLLSFNPRLKLGASLWEVFPEIVDQPMAELYRRAMRERVPVALEEFYEGIWFDIHVYPTDGGGLSVFFRDISEARLARDAILHLAHHDPLTGLANRTLFHQRLAAVASSGTPSATLLLDLDHFKEVNDSMGHPVGDLLLASTAQRLRSRLKGEDTIARLGGDEFAIIIADGPTRDEVTAIARDILGVVEAPHEIGGQSIRVGASVGITLSSGMADDADQLLREADIALYAAKSESRGVFRFFDPAMEASLLERQALRNQLAGAIERGELELVYQPIVDLHTQQVACFEALLRWRHPVHGLVPPDVFIPVAEASGLIVPIGDWVLRTACTEAMRWPETVSVAINLSSHQFEGDIAASVQDALEASGLSSRRLELEITETVMLDDSRTNIATLHRLRGLGIRIALDDFGTGYSSLGYLQHFPFSKIKIDRSFISGLPGNEESQAIVKMVIGLGKALSLRVTAEGVETEAQLDWVRRGCDEAQGYLLSRPVPPSEISTVIHRLSAPPSRERLRA